MVSTSLGFPSIFLRSINTGQKDFEVFSHPKDYSCCNHWNVESSDSKKTTPAGRICVDFWEMKVNSVTAVFAAEPSDQFSPPIIIRKLSSYMGQQNHRTLIFCIVQKYFQNYQLHNLPFNYFNYKRCLMQSSHKGCCKEFSFQPYN